MPCTWDDLRTLIEECAGEVDGLGDYPIDRSFEEIGYDSLAILETVSAVERRYRIRLADSDVGEIATPADFLALVNSQLTLQRDLAA
jgi:act minimal PKS acyl carrier protein